MSDDQSAGTVLGYSRMKDLNELETLIIGWAKARGIVPNATPESQVLKAVSEMGELADATAKRRYHEMRDAIGDVVVCLVNLCALQGWTLSECLNEVWEQIKDRKGTLLPNGCFVKEEPQSKQKNHELEGYLDGKRAGYNSGGTLGAEWYANNSNLTGKAKEDYISGFNAAIDEVEQKKESKWGWVLPNGCFVEESK